LCYIFKELTSIPGLALLEVGKVRDVVECRVDEMLDVRICKVMKHKTGLGFKHVLEHYLRPT
jgi:hypothetical protein